MRFADRVKQTTISTSAASIPLSGTVATFGTFPAAFEVGATGIVACMDDGKGAWEISVYTLTNSSTLTRTAILSSSNGGAAVTFPAGAKEVFCTVAAKVLADFVSLNDGITVAGLPRGVPQAADLISFARAAGGDLAITYGDFLALVNGNPPASDTTAPAFPDALSSASVMQTSFTLAWQAATDASGIARYEYSYDGSTWTSAGTALSVNLSGRTAGTTYTMRVRAIDPSGNISAVRTLAVTTAAASGDTQAPSMSGSISTSAVTSSGYTFGWTAGTDNVGVDHYETSIDGGASWESFAAGTLSRTVAGRPASTTDNLRVRAHDAAGNISNVLSGTVTTLAGMSYSITPYSGGTVKTTVDGTAPSTTQGTLKGFSYGATMSNQYVNIVPSPTAAWSGWGDSPTVPPARITATENTGSSAKNGMTPMAKGTGNAWSNTSQRLWVQTGSGDSPPKYYWVDPGDGTPVCMNLSTGTVVVGA
ncbi:fibronectin type III domain-containing protein [Massilia sp. HP4]|uniref:fibronectin type III domain-containing protein n=1 Tax=Massilia sp. HP4 TaxID=2562316 RepID=UPI0010C075EE|nr:fibronectin type III domain-containing protein [Massilia sp. HP4]